MRRARRCNHGFVEPVKCPFGCDLEAGVYMQNFARAGRRRRECGVRCVLCDQSGHVSKYCPETAVGRERASRIRPSELDLSDMRGEGSEIARTA